METWFYFALAAAIVGGIGAFTHKIVAYRQYDITVINIYSSFVSAIVVGLLTWHFSDFQYLWEFSSLIVLLASFTYFFTLVFKVKALQNIDAAVFFPLYKVAGPMFSIVLGVTIFSEVFTFYEWLGLFCSLGIPLLLITKAENKRQKNLKKGILILILASIIGTISISLTKFGSEMASNVWLFIFVGEIFLALSSVIILVNKFKGKTMQFIKDKTPTDALGFIFIMGISQALSAVTMVFAFTSGGTLAIVYTISSLYILIPIILSVLVYKEHFSIQKAGAMILAVAALILLK